MGDGVAMELVRGGGPVVLAGLRTLRIVKSAITRFELERNNLDLLINHMHNSIGNHIIKGDDLCAIDKSGVVLDCDREIRALRCTQLHPVFELGAVPEKTWYDVVVEECGQLFLRHACGNSLEIVGCCLRVGCEDSSAGGIDGVGNDSAEFRVEVSSSG